MTRKINAAAFKAKCLALIDEVAESGEPIIITKRGKDKVQLIAVREKPKTLWGATKGNLQDPRGHCQPDRTGLGRGSRVEKHHWAIR